MVTDHGWLMLPGSLPRAELAQHLTVKRKGRCARLKALAKTDQFTVPWHWDEDVRIAIAPGIHCYEAGKEYEHGGLSPQECIIPVLIITSADSHAATLVSIEQARWRGLRCAATLAGAAPGLLVDIRTKAGDPSTSLVPEPKSPDERGYVSFPVPDDDRIGEAAFVVVVATENQIRAQQLTTIGG